MNSKAPLTVKYFDSRFRMTGGVIKHQECSSNKKVVDRSLIESFFKQSKETSVTLAKQSGNISEPTHEIKSSHQMNYGLNAPSGQVHNPNNQHESQTQENKFANIKPQTGESDWKHQSNLLTMNGQSFGNSALRNDRHYSGHRVPSGKASPIAFRKSSKAHEEIELLYDFYTEKFKFTAEELQQNEPVPEYCWMHLSCIYWIPELFLKDHINNLDQRSITNIDKNRFRTPCMICNTTRGASISCSFEDCEEHFHTECARRAKLYLEIRTTTHTKFLIYCPKHTPLLFKNTLHSQDKKAREDISKFHRYFKRFFRNRKMMTDQIDIKDKIEEDQMSEISVEDIVDDSQARAGKKEKAKKPKKPEKLQREHLVKLLPFDQKLIISKLKKKMSTNNNYMFQVTLHWSNDDERYQVVNTNIPPKSIYTHKVPKTTPVWKEIAEETQSTVKAVHSKFQKAIETLKHFEKNPQELEVKAEPKANPPSQSIDGQLANDIDDENIEEINGKLNRLFKSGSLCLSAIMEW